MIETSQCGASEPFALRVIGNDMAPEFHDGHIVVVDPGGRLTSGCFVVAQLEDDMVLRQLKIKDGCYYLSTTTAGIEALLPEDGLKDIVGVVSQRSGKRRAEHKRYDV